MAYLKFERLEEILKGGAARWFMLLIIIVLLIILIKVVTTGSLLSALSVLGSKALANLIASQIMAIVLLWFGPSLFKYGFIAMGLSKDIEGTNAQIKWMLYIGAVFFLLIAAIIVTVPSLPASIYEWVILAPALYALISVAMDLFREANVY